VSSFKHDPIDDEYDHAIGRWEEEGGAVYEIEIQRVRERVRLRVRPKSVARDGGAPSPSSLEPYTETQR
jgi:hypothetical protein